MEEEEEEDGGGGNGSSKDNYNNEEGTIMPARRGPPNSKYLKMANAMSCILGTSSLLSHLLLSLSSVAKDGTTMTNMPRLATNRPMILSKTTTLQQQPQQKLKMGERALWQNQHNWCMENIVAMRLPLAPTTRVSAERLWKQKTKAKKKKTTNGTKGMKMSSAWRRDGKDNNNNNNPKGGDGRHNDKDSNDDKNAIRRVPMRVHNPNFLRLLMVLAPPTPLDLFFPLAVAPPSLLYPGTVAWRYSRDISLHIENAYGILWQCLNSQNSKCHCGCSQEWCI
jgi:hypothetical protein